MLICLRYGDHIISEKVVVELLIFAILSIYCDLWRPHSRVGKPVQIIVQYDLQWYLNQEEYCFISIEKVKC